MFVWLLLGCTAGEVDLYGPEGSGLRRGLTVQVELEATAGEIGEQLGWSDGIPGAEVRVHRIATGFLWQTALTDSSGVASFPEFIPGIYRLAAHRLLTDKEMERLGGGRRAFGDGTIISLTGPSTRALHLAPDQRGSLLIGELYGTSPYVVEVDWDYDHYLEVYNNSDSTIYLDGNILGWAYHIDIDCNGECALTERFRNDSEGVWARWFYRFPGSGTDYPLAPDAVSVVARDAIDQSRIHPSFPDLSNADFELFEGGSDVDNPAAANMPAIGLAPWFEGHGIRLYVGKTFFLSRPVDVETLARAWDDLTDAEWVRFPRETLLDMLATEDDDALEESDCPPCPQKVHRDFDRLAGGFIQHGEDIEYSVQRVVLGYTPDGRAIL